MSHENTPNKDHWKDLVKSLDLDIDFDDEPLSRGESSESSREEKTSDEITASDTSEFPEPPEIPTEFTSTSKADPLFDLGWNSPNEGEKESLKAEFPEESAAKTPENNSIEESKDHIFGFGLLPDEPQKEESKEKGRFGEKPVALGKEKDEPVPEVSLEEEVRRDDTTNSDGAGDWMALAAQLGVPIRSEAELQEETPAEEPVESESVPEALDEKYDPLAAWQSPVPAAKEPRGKKPKEEPEEFSWEKAVSEPSSEVPDVEDSEQEEPIIIGKPKESVDKPKKARRRGRRRGRQDHDEEEEIEVAEAEEVATPVRDAEREPSDLEEESSEESKSRKRRRRSRRSRKSTTVESEDRDAVEAIDEPLDIEIFEEEEEPSRKSPKSHRGIPSWEEAIGMVVDKNLSTRNGRSSETKNPRSRGGRGKSRRRGGRSNG